MTLSIYLLLWLRVWPVWYFGAGKLVFIARNTCQRHGPLARYVKLWVAHAPGMPETFSSPQRVNDPDMHHGTCVTHVPWCVPGSLTSGLLWSRWRGKRSRHSRRMRNPQFYVFGKRPMLGNDRHWSWFNIKKTHYVKTVLRSSYLHNGISYTGKMTSLYWIIHLDDLGWLTRTPKPFYIFNSLPNTQECIFIFADVSKVVIRMNVFAFLYITRETSLANGMPNAYNPCTDRMEW